MQPRSTIARARDLRRNMTGPERVLWWQLRSDVFKPYHLRRQAPVGPYFADFLSHRMKLVVELDGHTHTPRYDTRRDAWFAAEGFSTLRFPNAAVMASAVGVAEEILNWIRNEELRRQLCASGVAAPP